MKPDGLTGDQRSDEFLAELVVRRDVDAFAILYDRFAPAVHAMAVYMLGRAEAEEIVQDVFLRLWDRAGQFDVRRGRFRSWFMAIARNHILTQLRLRGHERQIAVARDVQEVLARQPDPDIDLEEDTSLRERRSEIVCALQQLPDEQRRVLVMAYFGGLSQASIARELGLPLGTVKKRTRLGLRKLRALLSNRGSTPERRDEDEDRVVRP